MIVVNDDVVDTFVNIKVLVSVDATDATNIFGE